ncbi:bifunctional molybdenum cofactor biosynthesis protein MoaC/MoaB [Francisella sp. 19X1-34]|uniref:bifunctional molybdenum cofactor biosynthesis protein MoaC/MoaB n=1 Tax=Francisella sp. 19X1-34 TaxID=3087177 RepID=UPI002E344768|nr:bifunctional molybdenum cofactor biosynthesis protein MoaC/MoaB [Francisella sp. 19X1-34]MED7789119.1 bifunctional molybdenum cofactor biosynthesis protein MoaC/MoaB [Francisella sp. 19X1-34]
MHSDTDKIIKEFFQNSSYNMINVGNKHPTHRRALATGKIQMRGEILELVAERKLEKGDVLPLAEIAGINGAKSTATLLPLCHPLAIDHVSVKTEINKDQSCVEVFCYVGTHAKTGVEMEAIAGVQAALLCIYDLCKMYGQDMLISDIRLLYKEGGKNDKIYNEKYLPESIRQIIDTPKLFDKISCTNITISDRASAKIYEDKSGKVLSNILEDQGAIVLAKRVIPDERELIKKTIINIVDQESPNLIITTGGTGVSPRDVTPEAIQDICERQIPGVSELLRKDGEKYTHLSWASRTIAGVYKKTLIVALPGNPNAVKEGLDALKHLLPHLVRIINNIK